MDFEQKNSNDLKKLLDKGIDDMESGRELPIEEAFALVSEIVSSRKLEREDL